MQQGAGNDWWTQRLAAFDAAVVRLVRRKKARKKKRAFLSLKFWRGSEGKAVAAAKKIVLTMGKGGSPNETWGQNINDEARFANKTLYVKRVGGPGGAGWVCSPEFMDDIKREGADRQLLNEQ